MNRTNKHTTLLIFAVLVTVFVMVVFAYVYHAINASIERAITANNAVKTYNARSQSEVNHSNKTTTDKLALLPNFFLSPDQVVVFIEYIEALSVKTGSKVTLASIDADKLENASPGKGGSFRAQVEAIGSWSSVMRVLSSVEAMPYKVLVDNVKLDRDDNGSGTKNGWKLSFDVKAAMIAPLIAPTTSK